MSRTLFIKCFHHGDAEYAENQKLLNIPAKRDSILLCGNVKQSTSLGPTQCCFPRCSLLAAPFYPVRECGELLDRHSLCDGG